MISNISDLRSMTNGSKQMSHKTLCGAKQSKFWGNTQCVFIGPISEAHFLSIKQGGYCSKHKHIHKWNRFFLISGKLQITIYRDDGEDVTTLESGEYTDVPPGIYHKFDCLEQAQCLEIYWVDNLNPEDIDRETVGGLKSTEKEKMTKLMPTEVD